MSFNLSINHAEILKNDSLQAKTVNATVKSLTDNVVDIGPDNKELAKDLQGAIDSKQDIFLKTEKGIIKIAKEEIPQMISNLKERLLKSDEYKVTGFGIDIKDSAVKVNFQVTDPKTEISRAEPQPLEIKTWKGMTAENIKAFKQLSPLVQGTPLLLKDPIASMFCNSAFSCSIKDLQALVGETEKNGKFSVKTFALTQEYLATKINAATNLNDLKILNKQLNELKSYFPNIETNQRHNQLTETLNAKIDKFADEKHNEISFTSDPEKLLKIREELIQLKDSTKDLNQLINIVDEKVTKVINKGLSGSKSIEEIEPFVNNLKALPADFPEVSKALMTKVMQNNLSGLIATKIDSFKNPADLNDCIKFAEKIKSFSEPLGEETSKALNEQAGVKLVSLLNDKLHSTTNLTEFKDFEGKLTAAKPFIPEGSFKYFEMAKKQTFDKSELYGDNGIASIKYSNITQGNLNDCFFLSAVAGLADKRPQDIAKMITASPDGKLFTVKFPGAMKAVTIDRPSEEYMKNHAKKAADKSIWVPVLEKAYSQYLLEVGIGKMDANKDTTGNINHGNLLSPGIEVMTGNPVDTDILTEGLNSLDDTRAKLSEALRNKRVVTASTFNAGDPANGIPKNHVYTILGFNPETDKVKIRNPWAQSPTGGIEGYTPRTPDTDPGVFEVSVKELYKLFNLIAYEQAPGFNPLFGGGI